MRWKVEVALHRSQALEYLVLESLRLRLRPRIQQVIDFLGPLTAKEDDRSLLVVKRLALFVLEWV